MRELWRRIWAPIGRRLEIGRAPGGKYWCCENEDNLEPVSETRGRNMTTSKARCVKCDRNHYVAVADPHAFGVTGADV